ncbi:MAG: tryptophan halogenase family protein [Phycisphaeraceae bacterium]
MIQNVVVLGSGSAGLLAALTLKRKLPTLDVRIVRDPAIGIIGVGEGSTPNFVRHLFDYVGVNAQRFYEMAKPTWKLGIQFKWGPRGHYNFTFDGKTDEKFDQLNLPNGFYCMNDVQDASLCSALMNAGKAFPRQPDGLPAIDGVNGSYSFHIENENLVHTLEAECKESGVAITDGKMVHAEQDDAGVNAIVLEDGQRIEADFFVDASGFRGELISGVLDEPFVSFNKTLFCDRAVVGGWKRTDEPILPHTVAEQMQAGWSWQIEHEHFINRGYVFCSDMISDEDAFAEFKAKNPKIPDTPRFVSFTSGYREHGWVKNVFSVGNAAGFVEPLEASALMVIAKQCKSLANILIQSGRTLSRTMRDTYNRQQQIEWGVIRDFLGLHYKFNTAMDTPFWRRCRQDTDLSGIQDLLDFYEENGPSQMIAHLVPDTNDFGVNGFVAMLIYNQAPCKRHIEIDPNEMQLWNKQRAYYKSKAAQGLGVKDVLEISRDPRWRWN